jgi:hypothetical protein
VPRLPSISIDTSRAAWLYRLSGSLSEISSLEDKLLVHVTDAFKDVGGASSKYATELSLFNSLKSTLEHLEGYVSNTSESRVK